MFIIVMKGDRKDMTTKDLFQFLGNGFQYLISVTQIEAWARIVGLVLSVIISILIIVDKIVTWWKKAKADGKIDEDEIKEGVEIIKNGAQEIKDHIDNK